ncbi:helix-turn-helix domain-containing protein [Aurantiacibacter poecillastricola]|uniref:helix-turn-helix domain-containing protein n=1 Tax=Aurantiacibacter poecillastricola TaxID=3064385 RepID=UPI00273F091C|nr:helix-turn-helix domain-containing protein [Aurantiacibacter sp. 219JJ12-13]MDP5260341.1 helix-turn-helix domain-containing protein [Aurantiacibacter sp. 219JJ12-13]
MLTEAHYPDWAGLHFFAEGTPYTVRIGDGPDVECPPFAVTGPTSRSIRLHLTQSVAWSLGVTPVGWARFGRCPANTLANKVVDGREHSTFSRLAPLLDIVRDGAGQTSETARRIGEFLSRKLPPRARNESQVLALHEALRNPAIGDVDGLVEEVGVSRRTLERLSSNVFGFPPKTLLRRQRFLRSLGKFTINPDRGWSASLDGHYVDQAHFVRDFRSFMDMTPSEYAQMPHPILSHIFGRRLAEHTADNGRGRRI